MLNLFRRTIREKGQGLTEYVLILAFIAGVAIAMFGGDGSLKGTLVSTVTGTTKILAGLFTDKTDWGNPANRGSFSDSNQTERYQHDQKMLENLANFFMDMTKEDVAKYLNNVGDVTTTAVSKVYLGNIVRDENGNVHFLVNGNNGVKVDTQDDLSGYMHINGGTYNYGYNDRVLNWIQGDYGPKNNDPYSLGYSSSYNYMVSDYAMAEFEKTNYNWNKLSFNDGVGGNGIKVRLAYTNDNGKIVVDKVRVTIDYASRNPNNNSSSAYSSDYSNGLEVAVRKGQPVEYSNVGWDAKL